MQIKGFDCIGFAAYALGDDGKFHTADLSQTATLSADLSEESDGTTYGTFWDAGDPYHYTLIGNLRYSTFLENRYGRRWLMKRALSPRGFRKWVRTQEKERRKRLKEVTVDD